MEDMVTKFLQYQTLIKIYHWRTNVYARHIASDLLLQKLNKNVDKLIESMQGARNKKISFGTGSAQIQLMNFSDKEMTVLLKEMSDWLNQLQVSEKDLQNIRDEIISDVHQTLYLFTLQ